MLALVFDKGTMTLRKEYPAPVPRRGEALVAVRKAGVCKTDLEILKGYMGFSGVMGHEFVGTVVRGPRAWLGRRVTADINCPCHRCDLCRRNLPTHCRNRGVLGIDRHDGVFAEYVAVPVDNLHAIPDSVSDDQAVFVEPLAAVFQMMRQVRFSPRDRVAVIGDGRLGQLAARVLRLRIDDLTLVGKHRDKLRLAERQGIATEMLARFRPACDRDVVIDCSGSAGGFDLAMRTCRPRGTLVLKSTFAASGGMNLAPIVINEVTVVGSRCGPFAPAIRALARNEVAVEDMISARFPLTEAVKALRAAATGHMKVVMDVRATE